MGAKTFSSDVRSYRETNDYAKRPPVEISEAIAADLLREAITTAYSSGSIGATISESTADFDFTVTFRCTRKGK